MSTFGQTIRARRLALGLPQERLAREIGVSKSYLSHVEKGRRPVTATMGAVIEERLGVFEQGSRVFVVDVDGRVARVRAMSRQDALRAAAALPETAWDEVAARQDPGDA